MVRCDGTVQFRYPEDISLLQVKYPLLRADILLLPSDFRSVLESKVLFGPLSVSPLLLGAWEAGKVETIT